MIRYTLVCTTCFRGWETYGISSCTKCGRVGEVRGRTLVVDLATAA